MNTVGDTGGARSPSGGCKFAWAVVPLRDPVKTAAQTGLREEPKAAVAEGGFVRLHLNALPHISYANFEKHRQDSLKTPGEREKPARFLKGP